MKKWKRERKIKLIVENNPSWGGLPIGWFRE